jgi:VWFA-related protein
MVKWAALLLFAGTALPAMAAKSLSVAELEQLLAANKGKSDGHIAQQLSELELTERVSLARLARWEKDFNGRKTAEELMKLADSAAFLKPPAEDVIRDPAPDGETQTRMFDLAMEYVRKMFSELPNFFATRATTHFEDMPSAEQAVTNAQSLPGHNMRPFGLSMGGPEAKPLHVAGTYSVTVTFRDGSEVRDAAGRDSKNEASPAGLTTYGEFGPMLGAVLEDASRGQVTWSHWEQGENDPVAVFHYSVPEDRSNWMVGIPNGTKLEMVYPGYHGEIAIEPATGSILRLSAVADMAQPHQTIEDAILVEYASVTIGDRTYICPVHGVAYSKVPVVGAGEAVQNSAAMVQTQLNDVRFKQYHLFRSDARIVPNERASNGTNAAQSGGTQAAETTAAAAPASANASAAVAAGAPTPATVAEAPQLPNSGSAPSAETAATRPPNSTHAPPAEAAASGAAELASTQNVKTAEASLGPAAPSSPTPSAMATGEVLHAKSNLVLVDVVVTDHDRPVQGLDRSRFHVFEDGHEQPIASFEENGPPASVEIAKPPALPPNTYSNIPVHPESTAANVLLLDSLNTPAGDQEQVRKRMIAFLGTIKPGTPLAIFSLSSRLRMIAGFTTDVAHLSKALEDQKTNSQASAGLGLGSDASMSTRQFHDALTLSANTRAGNDADMKSQLEDRLGTSNSDQRVMMTLDALSQLAQYLAAIPGRKNLIWISGSFPIGLLPDPREPLKNLRDYREVVQRTDGLLAAARVAVYPVDVRGLMRAPTADASDMGSDLPNIFGEETSQEQEKINTIAKETGGRGYTNSNGLEEVVERIVANGSSYYTLSYVPPPQTGGRKGGEFHKIEVKVGGGKYQLAYRGGYYADDGSKPESGSDGANSAMAAAAVLGAPPSTQILFQERVLPEGDPQIQGPVPDEGSGTEKPASLPAGTHSFVVDLNVDLQDLTFAEDAGGARRAQLECAFLAYDSEGKAVKSLGRRFDLKLETEQYERMRAARNSVPMRLVVELPASAVVLRTVVYDPASVKTGSLEIPIQATSK